MTLDEAEAQESFLDAVGVVGPALLSALDALEKASRRLHPPAIRALRQVLGPVGDRLEEAIETLEATPAPAELHDLRVQLGEAAAHAAEAVRQFSSSAGPERGVAQILGAMRSHCRAQESLFPLRKALPPVNRFFLEAAVQDRVDTLDPDPAPDPEARVGIFHARNDLEERGGFSLYVPESFDPAEPLPLVVALHGGSGHGRDFLWTWLREARSRRCLLLAPTARGATWSLGGADVDAANLRAMVEYVAESWAVDRERILLTGLSDGATYALLCGLQPDMPFTALAPLSGVLHPANFANGNLERARGRRIYLVHGALDWMFPVAIARMADEELRKAGAEVTYREIEDLSHTYAREENARILEWLDPGLALGR